MEEKRDWGQETQHFEHCKSLIAQNIESYEREYEAHHKETAKLMCAMKSGDAELYARAMTSAGMEEHAKIQLEKNKSALAQPYFGRIDYKEKGSRQTKRLYIGKHGVSHGQTEVIVADWRAPISGVYYENELGEGECSMPDGRQLQLDLQLKRTYDVREGELKGYYDSDVAANDRLLIQYLSRHKEAVLGDIIATIQKEQNEIIRESPFCNILVQGVAGSGKTTVAMHRISYILYNYKERFTSNEFCIVGGNDLLLKYITSGLPELDVPDIKQKRMDAMLTHLLGKEWTKKHQVIDAMPDAAVRSKMDFMLDLEIFLMRRREEYFQKGLRDRELGVILTKSSKERLFVENPDLSIAKLMAVLDDRVKTRIKFLAPEGEREYIKKKYLQYKDFYKKRIPRRIDEIYEAFLTEYEKKHPGSIDLKLHGENIAEKKYDVYDLAALLVVQYRFTRKSEDEEFGQIIIDEAQDFGIAPYYALRRVLPKCYFTIMGDVSQNINYETGLNDWNEMRKWILNGEKDVFRILSKSYRNTIEISDFAGKILEKASFGHYRTQPVIRHGMPVQEITLPELEMYDRAAEIIRAAHAKGYQSIAVICKNQIEADWVGKWLEAEAEILPIALTKGMEFDVAVLWNPNLQEVYEKPKAAKLWYVAATRALHELYLLYEEKENQPEQRFCKEKTLDTAKTL